jgi:kynurenine formamidase
MPPPLALDPSRFVSLHHPLEARTPTYGDAPAVVITPRKLIRRGEISNSHLVAMPLHAGTHVDLPRHFSDEQPTLSEIRPDEWLFSSPLLIDLPRGEMGVIAPDDLVPHASALRECDFLAVRTGYSSERFTEAFRKRGPAFTAAAAKWLLEAAPRLRAVAVDAVSGASPARPEDGIEWHRVMLGARRGDRYVFLLEDVNLVPWRGSMAAILVVPLAVKDADGVPCSIFGVPR